MQVFCVVASVQEIPFFFFLEQLIICVCAGYAQGTFQRLSTRQHSIKKESKVKGEEKNTLVYLTFL